jgi:hypothetical protein
MIFPKNDSTIVHNTIQNRFFDAGRRWRNNIKGIERTHAKWSTYFVTMVPDENYLDPASRLVVRDGVEM